MSGKRRTVNSIDTRIATVILADDDLIELRFIDEYEVQTSDVVEIQKAMRLLDAGIRSKALVIPGKFGGISREAREQDIFEFRNPDTTFTVAIVSNQLHQRILGTMYFKWSRKKYRYKFFREESKARKWLLKQD